MKATLPSTAMVRVGDVVNSESETIHQQLGGGLTATNLLHGSANPIGGQNCVIKLRDGAAPEELKFAGAPAGIKFALGENVKQIELGRRPSRIASRRRAWACRPFTRTASPPRSNTPPRSRSRRREGGPPVRRDLELEAIAEIIRGERLIHCHSYRQDEILAFLRVMESFGVRVARCSTSSRATKWPMKSRSTARALRPSADWWAYKFEVYDAIPLRRQHHARARRECVLQLRFVRSRAAAELRSGQGREIRRHARGGGAEVRHDQSGQAARHRQDGRLAGSRQGRRLRRVERESRSRPSSLCLETWIDGKQYFEREAAHRRGEARNAERLALIDKAKKLATDPPGDPAAAKAQEKFFFRALEDRQSHPLRRLLHGPRNAMEKLTSFFGVLVALAMTAARRDAAPARRDRPYRRQGHAHSRRRAGARWEASPPSPRAIDEAADRTIDLAGLHLFPGLDQPRDRSRPGGNQRRARHGR